MECENLLLSQQILSPTQEVNIWEIFTLIVFRRRECGKMELAQRKRDDASTQYSIFLNPRLMVQ